MSRIRSLDMLRGYALACIMLNHMPRGVLRQLTLTNFAIYDAAELFVLLSGFLVGLVWMKVEARQGRLAAQWRFARRAGSPIPQGRGDLYRAMRAEFSRLLPQAPVSRRAGREVRSWQ